MSELEEQLQAGEWAACGLAAELGPPALAQIRPWLEHAEPLRRQLAVDCASEAGGDEVAEVFLERLSDEDAQVRLSALRGLLRHPPTKDLVPRLLQVLDTSPDPHVRATLPKVLADAGQAPSALVRRLADLDQASLGLLAALGKLGQVPARSRFVALARRVRGRRVKELAEVAEWIGQPWVLWGFLGHLDRDEIAADVSTHAVECLRRASDVSLDLVLAIAPQGALDVEPKPKEPYDMDDVIHAKRYVLALEELPPEGVRI